jgi:4-amino-4-deoxy-L-arabinose transferase-like glycosyltransferase
MGHHSVIRGKLSSKTEVVVDQGSTTKYDSIYGPRQRLAAPVVVLSIILIVAVTLVLRVYCLPSQGFMQWDEGLHALEGQFLADTWHRLAGMVSDPGQAPGGRPPTFVRPFHSILLSIGMLLGGTSALSAQLVSASSGVLTVLAVFLLGRALYTTGTGLLAAAFLATMPLHVTYSRLVLSEANGILLFTLSLLAYWRARVPGNSPVSALVGAGLLLGLSVTTNLRLYIMPAVFVICEVALWLGEHRHSRLVFMRRLLTIAYSALVPVALAFLFFWWLKGYCEASHLQLSLPVVTYEEQLGGFWNQQNSYSRPFLGGIDLAYYPVALWTFVGPVLMSWFIVSLAVLLKARKSVEQNILLLAWLLVPFVFYAFLTDKAPRFLAIALPAIALIAARGLTLTHEYLAARTGWPRALRISPPLIAAAVVLAGSVASMAVAQQSSGYPAALAFLQQRGIDRAIVGQALPVEFLSGQQMIAVDIPDSVEILGKAYAQGYRFMVIDDQAYLTPQHLLVASAIERRIQPVASYPDTLKQGPLFLLEHSEWMKVDLHATMALYYEIRSIRGPSEVRIYDVGEYLKATGLPKPAP